MIPKPDFIYDWPLCQHCGRLLLRPPDAYGITDRYFYVVNTEEGYGGLEFCSQACVRRFAIAYYKQGGMSGKEARRRWDSLEKEELLTPPQLMSN